MRRVLLEAGFGRAPPFPMKAAARFPRPKECRFERRAWGSPLPYRMPTVRAMESGPAGARMRLRKLPSPAFAPSGHPSERRQDRSPRRYRLLLQSTKEPEAPLSCGRKPPDPAITGGQPRFPCSRELGVRAWGDFLFLPGMRCTPGPAADSPVLFSPVVPVRDQPGRTSAFPFPFDIQKTEAFPASLGSSSPAITHVWMNRWTAWSPKQPEVRDTAQGGCSSADQGRHNPVLFRRAAVSQYPSVAYRRLPAHPALRLPRAAAPARNTIRRASGESLQPDPFGESCRRLIIHPCSDTGRPDFAPGRFSVWARSRGSSGNCSNVGIGTSCRMLSSALLLSRSWNGW